MAREGESPPPWEDEMQLTDTQPEGELALGGIEALAEPKRAERWMRPVEILAAGFWW